MQNTPESLLGINMPTEQISATVLESERLEDGKPKLEKPGRHLAGSKGCHQRRRGARYYFYQVLGLIGEVLITIGLLIGLFIVWQIWWTNIEANNVLNKQVTAISRTYGQAIDRVGNKHKEEPPVMKDAADYEVMGLVYIPRFGKDYVTPIRSGVGANVLDTGAFGHYPETVNAGALGNFSIASHRDMYGSRMWNADELTMGDAIIVENEDYFWVYKVVETRTVLPADVWAIAPDPFLAADAVARGEEWQITEPTRRLLTLTTCDPPLVASHRLIIHAELDYWMKRSEGTPEELLDNGNKVEAS